MSIFKRKNSLKARINALELYLGIAWIDDGWGDKEYVERNWGEFKKLKQQLKGLENLEKKKGK